MQITRIATSKLHSTQIVDVHVVEVGIQMVAQTEIKVRIHDVAHTLANVVNRHITIGNGHSIHSHNLTGGTVFIAKGLRQAERDIHIALCMQSLRNTIVSSSKSTEYVRRILPSKH